MQETSIPSFSEQVCFDLYAASRAVTSAYRPVLTELGVTYPQYLVLLALWEQDDRTVKQLADMLRLDHGTLTPLLRRMETRGLLTRRRSADDERFVRIGLTPQGDALRVHASRIHCNMKEAMGIDDAGLAALQATLRMLTARVAGERTGDVPA